MKIYKTVFVNEKLAGILRVADNSFIPLVSANTDFSEFKRLIMSGEAELQDADGNVMLPEQAREFVATLP